MGWKEGRGVLVESGKEGDVLLYNGPELVGFGGVWEGGSYEDGCGARNRRDA